MEASPLRRQLLLLLGSKLHLAGLHVRRRLDPLRGHKGVEELSLDACAETARVESGRLRSQRLRWLLLEARVDWPLHRRLLPSSEPSRLHLHRLLWPLLLLLLLQSHKASRLRLPRAGQSGGQSLLLVAALHPVTRVEGGVYSPASPSGAGTQSSAPARGV